MTLALSVRCAPNRPLKALRATALESLFQSWRGASGRRYVCSVYPVADEPAFDCGRAVVVAVRQVAAGTEVAFVFQPAESGGDFALWAARARRCGAGQFHVHLLAETAQERAKVADDLAPQSLRAAA